MHSLPATDSNINTDPFLDLSPARWIWLPAARTLQNMVALFRREIVTVAKPFSVTGWIIADSRYRLFVNGQRVQWGPAPSDPRDQEVDPIDLTPYFSPGPNVLAVEVLYFGTGDGTWPMGSPGLLLKLDIDTDGQTRKVVSDARWRCCVDRAWRPGQYKRHFLRAHQEIVDSRRHPHDWTAAGFDDSTWLTAAELRGGADRPSIMAGAADYQGDAQLPRIEGEHADVLKSPRLRKRTIPLMYERTIVSAALIEAGHVDWHRDPDDWFEFRLAGAFTATRGPVTPADADGGWTLPATAAGVGQFLTFALPEQMTGWPVIDIEAPPGSIIELMYQEGHDPVAGPAWLESYFFHWSRLTCRGGRETFETFDFESIRWIQLHVRSPVGPVRVRSVGMRRRHYPWPTRPLFHSDEPALERLFAAAVNTMANAGQDQFYDGGGRERQQYSGDCGHQLTAWRLLTGDRELPERFLRTWSEGQSHEGWFLDCWPAYDRLHRLSQRCVGVTEWGPLLDHGVGYVFDQFNHYFETGNIDASREAWPRLKKQMAYFERLVGADGLLPVEDLGLPAVWIDHDCFEKQRHKQCAFNLYTSAMLTHAMAALAEAFAEPAVAEHAREFGKRLLAATVSAFWDPQSGLFVDNLPWLKEEAGPRTCDRALATALLFDQCPGGRTAEAIRELAEMPSRCGPSYPPNAGWRYHALARGGRADVVVKELRERWSTMRSVVENCTLSEAWTVKPDGTMQWSHCPLQVFNVFVQDVIGLKPIAPGFAAWELRPALSDLGGMAVDVHTVGGVFRIRVRRDGHVRRMSMKVPDGVGPGQVTTPDAEVRALIPGGKYEFLC